MLKKMLRLAKTGAQRVNSTLRQSQTNGMLNKLMHSSVMRQVGNGGKFIGSGMSKIYKKYNMSANVHKNYKNIKPFLHRKSVNAGIALVGAAGMTAISVMNGAMSAASNNMATRYLQDSRYSSRLLQHRVGNAAGNSTLNIGNHVGLSLALSHSRHG